MARVAETDLALGRENRTTRNVQTAAGCHIDGIALHANISALRGNGTGISIRGGPSVVKNMPRCGNSGSGTHPDKATARIGQGQAVTGRLVEEGGLIRREGVGGKVDGTSGRKNAAVDQNIGSGERNRPLNGCPQHGARGDNDVPVAVLNLDGTELVFVKQLIRQHHRF